MNYDDMFGRATGRSPYPYQRRLALAEGFPAALSAPTGAGKTAAAVLAWLYKRRFAGDAVRRATPRRLVVCLPMRTLVGQTAGAVSGWLERLGLLERGRGVDRGDGVGVHVVMGGRVDDDWHLHPERDIVLIGTQDMLLSRALNRGYAESRFLWPWQYGLLSNDCLWVFDEVQLMGVGLATGLQLAALREQLGAFGPARTLFMSATLEPGWLATVDHPPPAALFTLGPDDLDAEDLSRRRRASKRLTRAKTALSRGDKGALGKLGDEILARHVRGTRTLVVVNTVDRAVALFDALHKKTAKAALDLVLLHSRFRPGDREAALGRALAEAFDGIVVSTQVIEAGVDLSARTLFMELAPFASLVQRAGRCNRAGEHPEADVVWIDHDDLDERAARPYGLEELVTARGHLRELDVFNPEAIDRARVALPLPEPAHVLRRRDVLDLFDTTADLGGADLDVSRFIREGEERDAQVFWRSIEGDSVPDTEPRPAREELCPVPFLALRDWVAGLRRAFRWDALDGAWKPVRDRAILPGAVLLLRAADGGYDPLRGFAPVTDPVPIVSVARDVSANEREEAMDGDQLSELKSWVTLTTHATDTRQAAEEIIAGLDLPPDIAVAVVRAARAHDLGKAHPVFQNTMRAGYTGGDPGPWAKSGNRVCHERRGFRHELASALAWLAEGDVEERDLIAYLLAAHHGKVRLSLRAMPNDAAPDDGRRHARGVWEGDMLPATELGDGVVVPAHTLSLEPMLLGRHAGAPSWMERVMALRERLGPFRLAYLEALVRAADVRASMREARS
ncbi:MAG: CRISPR-associated endonuclease Cas3'' [Byssovorax sp.]